AVEAVDDGSGPAAGAGGRGHDLAPGGTVHAAAGGEVDLAGLEGVEGICEAAEWPVLRASYIFNSYRHGATNNTVGGIEGFDRLGQELVPAAFPVQDVAHHCGEQAITQQGEEFRIGKVRHLQVESITCGEPLTVQQRRCGWFYPLMGAAADLKLAENRRILGVSEFVPLYAP